MKKPHPEISAVLYELDEVRNRAKDTIDRIQSECKHLLVGEKPFRSNNFGYDSPVRKCFHCGFKETGSTYSGSSSWARHDYGEAVLGNTPERIITLEWPEENFIF